MSPTLYPVPLCIKSKERFIKYKSTKKYSIR